MSSFFAGFCSGIGAIVAASVFFGVVMLAKARDADEDDALIRPSVDVIA